MRNSGRNGAEQAHIPPPVGLRTSWVSKCDAEGRLPVPVPVPGTAPQWCIAIGAWGDTFAACGNALAALRANNADQTGFVHYGFDANIAAWLRLQPFVREVVSILPPSWPAYLDIVRSPSRFDPSDNKWIARMLEGTAIEASRVWHTCLSFTQAHYWRPEIWHNAELPRRSRRWAKRVVEESRHRGGRVYLLNPRSEQSMQWLNHWPYWERAVDWLLAQTEHTYLLTGQGWEPHWQSERLVNLVGKTDTCMEVLALAEASDGIIGTSNCLSLWSVIQNIPALICHNAAMVGNAYFPLWTDRHPNTIIQYGESFHQWERRVRVWMM